MEMTKRYSFVKGEERVKLVPRFKVTNQPPDYSTPKAKALIRKELKAMEWEVKHSEKGSSFLVADEHDRIYTRAHTKSTFPKYVQDSGAGSTKEFLKVLSQKKGVRFDRIQKEAINRLENGYMNDHGYDEPNRNFLVASKQLYDNKNIVFRRVRGRIIPMRIPYEKRGDLVPF